MAENFRCPVCGAPPERADGELCAECRELLRWFRSYFADVPKLDLLTITPRTRFIEDLALDSLDYIDWVLEAESVFGVRIPDRDAERLRTVGDYLGRLRNDGARWLPNQDIEIEKKSWGRRDWKAVTRGGPAAR
jgi:acyl carrier protein